MKILVLTITAALFLSGCNHAVGCDRRDVGGVDCVVCGGFAWNAAVDCKQ